MAPPQGKKIGGFLGLELPLATPTGISAWHLMTAGSEQTVSGVTARSVLAILLDALRPKTIWYPAYACPEMILGSTGADIRFFPVGRDLEPDSNWLSTQLEAGDAVVAIDYFGRAPNNDFVDLTVRRRDVFWIEDCAQAIASGRHWGDWLLYSPRKLFGVADGGIGVCRVPEKKVPIVGETAPVDQLTDLARLAPVLWRFEDIHQTSNQIWFPAFLESERLPFAADGDIGPIPMSHLTRCILEAIDAEHIVGARKANAAFLHDRVPEELRFFQHLPDVPLIGYPIVLKNRDRIAAELAKKGVFCPVHWRELPSPVTEFAEEHHFSAAALTLPCDQRYGAAEMTMVLDALFESI